MEVLLETPHAKRQFDKAPADIQVALRAAAKVLATDPHAGTPIRLTRVPRKTRAAWNARLGRIGNLAKLDLPGAWRALYTVFSQQTGGRVERRILFIEVLDHQEYDRLLGYHTS